MKGIVKYCISLVTLLALSCSEPKLEEYDSRPHGVISIAHLKALCREGATTITDDISLEAYVVANDLFGEYRNAIVLCDESGGIEVAVECPSTAVRFPISARVVVQCTGLALGSYGGIITLGAAPAGSYKVDRIAEKDIERHLIIDTSQPKEIEPQKITIAELGTSHIGNYIALEYVTFGNEASLCWCDKDPKTGEYITTTRTLHDRAGNTIGVRTIADCTYRAEKIPEGYGSVWGVVEYYDDTLSLRIINHRIEF